MTYHVNPETGEANKCRAVFKCRFDQVSEHFSTKSEAQAAFELAEQANTLAAFKKSNIKNHAKVDYDYFLNIFNTSKKVNSEFFNDEDLVRRANFQRLFNKLSSSQKGYLNTYYNEEHSVIINKLLQRRISFKTLSFEQQEQYKKTIKFLDAYIKAFKKHSKTEIVFKGAPIYSKIERSSILRTLDKIEPGSVLIFNGYTSTSVSEITAQNFMKGTEGLIYEIVTTKGAFLNEGVQEVILARNTRLVFVGYEFKNNIITIRLGEL